MATGRKQFNIAYTTISPSLTLLEKAENVTGQPASKIVKVIIDTYLPAWLDEELARRRQKEEAIKRADEELAKLRSRSERPHDAITMRQIGKRRPQYRGEEGIQPEYAEVAAMRVPATSKLVARYEDVAVSEVRRRPSARPAPDMAVTHNDTYAD